MSFCCNSKKNSDLNYYKKHGKPVCRKCFTDLCDVVCTYCNEAIIEKMISLEDQFYHLKCFICGICRKEMGKGGVQHFNTMICHAKCIADKLSAYCAYCKKPIHGDRYRNDTNNDQVHKQCATKYKNLKPIV